MAAHGYGIAAEASPNLIFSNVIWGHFVQSIPQINGVLGYSIATLGILVIVGTIILYAPLKLGLGWLVSVAILALVLVRAVLFPQFTINAGLLTVSAIACWHLYGQHGNIGALLAGCLLVFSGYLIRSHEFLLVFLIALPLLPWAKLVADRSAKIAAIVLLLVIGSSALVNYHAYQGKDWQAFKTLNTIRVPFTDYGADAKLKQRPELLSRHGYTSNDINLIRFWFFVDQKIANPFALKAMLAELGPMPTQSGALKNGWTGIARLMHPILMPCVLAAIFFLLMQPSRKLLITWGLAATALFVIGMLGRPGVLRIYIPIAALLLIAPFLTQAMVLGTKSILRWRLAQGVVLAAALFNTSTVCFQSAAAKRVAEQVRNELQDFTNDTVIVWGGVFPFEAAYPLLKQSESAMAYQLYALGSFTLAPFSRSYFESTSGKGMVERLVSPAGVPIIANEQRFDFLTIYCNERFGGVLQTLANHQYGKVLVSQRRCERSE